MRTVVNAYLPKPRFGGNRCPAPVREFMAEAMSVDVDMAEFLPAVGRYLARSLGLPAACPTAGAAAGVALAAYAAVRERSGEQPGAVVALEPQRTVYRAAAGWFGPRVVTAGRQSRVSGPDIATALRETDAAAVLYVAGAPARPGVADVVEVAEVCAELGRRLVVDLGARADASTAAAGYAALAPSCVQVVSGSSGLGGPQGSGFLAGEPDFVRWCLDAILDEESVLRLARPGKEATAGLVAAVRRSGELRERGTEPCDGAGAARDLAAIAPSGVERITIAGTRRMLVHVGSADEARQLADRLWAGEPRVYVGVHSDALLLDLDGLEPLERDYLVLALRSALHGGAAAP